MRIDYLITLRAVVKEGSLLSAAKSLGMSVSTISSQIASVEKFFDIVLLDRKAKGVELSKEGKIAYEAIEELADNVDKTKKYIKSIITKEISIAIGCVGVPLVAELQMKYIEENPDVTISTVLATEREFFQLLDHNDVNIVLAGYISTTPNREKYIFEEIGMDKQVLLLPPGHELENKDKIHIKDVLSYPMVTLSNSYGLTLYLDDVIARGMKDAEMTVECSVNDVFSQIYGVSSGLGTAITSYLLAEKYEKGGLLKIREIEDFSEKKPIYVICNKTGIKNPEIRKLYEYLTENGRELVSNYNI
jgi:DNA-binding transcriptional LysR family regulator